jgi:integrase
MTDISRPLAAFVEASKTPWVTPHVLRHTWGSLKAMKGASLYDIAKVMGDKIETIEKYYLHLTPDHLRSVINL